VYKQVASSIVLAACMAWVAASMLLEEKALVMGPGSTLMHLKVMVTYIEFVVVLH
jgi:hypothetical protein